MRDPAKELKVTALMLLALLCVGGFMIALEKWGERGYAVTDPEAYIPKGVYIHPYKTSCGPGVEYICRDGSFSYSKVRNGACSWHGGVREECY